MNHGGESCLPQVLFFLKKYADFVIFKQLWSSGGKSQGVRSAQLTMLKTRIKILYKKTRCPAPSSFFIA